MRLLRRSFSRWAVPCAVSVLFLGENLVAGPILHERFEPSPADDLNRRATTSDGSLPAAIDTPSGVVSAPSDRSPQAPRPRSVYGGASTPTSPDATYQIDRMTTQPDVVSYDEPFSPSVVPFKRSYAFDSVGPHLELTVADRNLRKLAIGGEVEAGEDAFYGDLEVDLVEGSPVRIPSVGPGAKIRALRVDPPTPFRVVADGADNWFIVAERSKRARVLMQLSIPREVFGSRFANTSWAALAPLAEPLPSAARDEAARVVEAIGVDRDSMTPAQALSRLVNHFRAFAPSEEIPQAATTEALYEELALSQKGVCRHRSYAFLITALSLGLPTRMVHNEAHAWVEVSDGRVWHRIDLGGAAGALNLERPSDGPVHRPPSDPFGWPEHASPGLDLGVPTSGSQPSAGSSSSPGMPVPEPPPASSSTRGSGQEASPQPEVRVQAIESSVRRGHPLRVVGKVATDGVPCSFGRVDVELELEGGAAVRLGSLATDQAGRFGGEVVLPLDVAVGNHQVVVSVPKNSRCAAAR